jgi:polyphosphate kinase 2 (PPK2 family)
MIDRRIIDSLRVKPGRRVRLKDRPCDPRDLVPGALEEDELEQKAREVLEESRETLEREGQVLYASDKHAILAIFQAMDAAGKDGTIRHVMSGVNPQGCHVTSFKQPSEEELDHDYLWRCVKALPERGRIGIFNRSYYEEVLVVRVHPEILESQKLPSKRRGKELWRERYEDIVNFERYLSRNGTTIVKFFLHVSKKEQ